MNVKFSPESVRMRVSLSEAEALVANNILKQEVPGILVMQVMLIESGESIFSLVDEDLKVTILREDLLSLLEQRASRDSCIRVPLNDEGLEFIFEIDLFSRKKRE